MQEKLIKEALHETKEYLDNLFNYGNVPIIIWNPQYKITRFNKAFESLTGRFEKDVIGKSLKILFPHLSKDSSMEIIRNTVMGERLEAVEIDIVHINHSVITLLCNLATIMSSDGKTPIGTIMQGYDITNRKRAEAENKKQEDELNIANKELASQNKEKEKRAVELIIANKELVIQNREKEKREAELTLANKELAFQNDEKEKRAAELNIANKELDFQNKEKEKRASELIIANKELVIQHREKEKRADELIMANKELAFQNDEKEKRAAELNIANKELDFQNKEKEKRAAELIIANKKLVIQNREKEKRADELIIANKELAFQNKEKEKRAAELNIANKEKEKRASELSIANRELAFQVEANKILEQFTYVVSHNLQEPLRTVSNYIQVFKEDYSNILDHTAIKYLNLINNSTKRMSALLKNLGDISRLGRNIKLTNVDCKKIINEVIADLETLIKKSNAIIEVKEMPFLNAYEVEMRQLFQNLITNAIKYQKKYNQPKIQIRAEKINETWKFSVSDNGIGIAPENFDKVFNIFQRLHTDAEYEGSGIGLSNCKKIVQLHHGEIWIESNSEKGATFYFTIPNLKV